MEKYLKTKGLWSFWLLIAVVAVIIYVVAWQTGLTLEEVNNNGTTSFVLSVGKPKTAKMPVVPTKPVTR